MDDYSKQKLSGYYYSKGMEYIIFHWKKYKLMRDTFISPNIKSLKKITIFLDFVVCAIIYGSGINDYFQYNFFRIKMAERRKFIVGRKWIRIIKVCNHQIKQKLFDDKGEFNKEYRKYLGRDWLDLSKCTYEEFCDFTRKYSKIMYKNKGGSGGNGIGIYQPTINNNFKEDYNIYRNKQVLFEEILFQHPDMAKFNPSSVNTIRLVTIYDGKHVHLMNAVFRMGNGEGCTDNFHHFGLAALIDIKTGIVYTSAVDKKNQKFEVHPKSGEQIVGFAIPCWNSIVNTVKSAAMVTPWIRYVGWDVALKSDGSVCIIEGNCASDPDIIQMPDQIGKWEKYRKVINKI